MKHKTTIGTFNDYIKANKKASREEELEKNGGRWVAKDRVHLSKKTYNRKENKKIDFDCSLFVLYYNNVFR